MYKDFLFQYALPSAKIKERCCTLYQVINLYTPNELYYQLYNN